MLPAGLPVPIPAAILVIAAVPTNVPAAPRIIPAAKPVQPSADRFAVTAIRHAQAAVRLIPEVLWDITNAAVPAGLVQPLVRPVLPPPTPAVVADQPRMNAEPRLVIILMNHAVLILLMFTVHMAVPLPALAVQHADPASPVMLAKAQPPPGKKVAPDGVIRIGTVLTSTMSGAEPSTNVRPIPAVQNHGKLIVMPAAVITAGQPAMRLVRE